GRYATILVLPVLMLIHLCQHIGKEPLRPEQTFRDLPAKPLFVTMLLLLPLVMFTGFHGQQLWQEDAGNALAGVTSEGNSSFLLIADSTLAMHSLYVLKTEADLSGELNISGYWRTPSDALSFLNTTSVDAVILAPGVVFEMTDGLWVSHEAQASPFTLSSWGFSDGWVLYLPS
ncbi:MAG: hypothetical protein HOI79_05670, partial [Euryarchaeota archaeon]|nr:hypothetical protein [Euryarchaeota archaeon]